MKHIDIAQVIGSPSALTQEQGNLVYSQIIDSFKNSEPITLDFSNVESMISPFLNNAIGKLYENYNGTQIKSMLKLESFPPEKNSTLNIVINNAKRFYANKAQYEQIVREVIDNA